MRIPVRHFSDKDPTTVLLLGKYRFGRITSSFPVDWNHYPPLALQYMPEISGPRKPKSGKDKAFLQFFPDHSQIKNKHSSDNVGNNNSLQ